MKKVVSVVSMIIFFACSSQPVVIIREVPVEKKDSKSKKEVEPELETERRYWLEKQESDLIKKLDKLRAEMDKMKKPVSNRCVIEEELRQDFNLQIIYYGPDSCPVCKDFATPEWKKFVARFRGKTRLLKFPEETGPCSTDDLVGFPTYRIMLCGNEVNLHTGILSAEELIQIATMSEQLTFQLLLENGITSCERVNQDYKDFMEDKRKKDKKRKKQKKTRKTTI